MYRSIAARRQLDGAVEDNSDGDASLSGGSTLVVAKLVAKRKTSIDLSASALVKLAGAASQSSASLDELEASTKKAVLQTRSVGVSMSPGSIPATGKPTFELEKDKVGLGMGIHGEPGVAEIDMTSADELTPKMLELIFEDFEKDDEVEALKQGDEIVFLVNSLGATTMMECLICLRKAKQMLNERGIKVYDTMVGPLVTCQEMTGISFSVTRLDDELKKLWDMPCESVCYSKMQGPGE